MGRGIISFAVTSALQTHSSPFSFCFPPWKSSHWRLQYRASSLPSGLVNEAACKRSKGGRWVIRGNLFSRLPSCRVSLGCYDPQEFHNFSRSLGSDNIFISSSGWVWGAGGEKPAWVLPYSYSTHLCKESFLLVSSGFCKISVLSVLC